MSFFAQKFNEGHKDFCLLISSPGGSVQDGIAIYNFLKALPINLATYNIGVVDSISNVIFLAGKERYACKNSSFLFHGVGINMNQGERFGEKNVKEQLAIIQRDQNMISDIIADNTKLKKKEVERMFYDAKTKTPDQAIKDGIINEIKEPQIKDGDEVAQFVFKR